MDSTGIFGWIIVAAGLFVLAMLVLSARKARNATARLPIESHQSACRRKECEETVDSNGVTRKHYRITFETPTDEICCTVPFKVFEAIESNTEGLLRHRGNMFVSFTAGERTISLK